MKKRDQSRSIKNIYNSLLNQMTEHTEKHHQHIDTTLFNQNVEETKSLDLSCDNSNSLHDELMFSHDSSSGDE